MAKELVFTKITVNSKDLNTMKTFYTDVLKLVVLEETEQKLVFGFTADGAAILELQQVANALSNEHATRLYHFAILLQRREDLGALLLQLAKHRVPLGAGDHLVSEALYIKDPEGNDIELYWDRPTDMWTWDEDLVEMATLPVDTDSLMAAATGPWQGFPSDTVIGHLHFYGSDVVAADKFYTEILGMDIVAKLGGQAHFYSINNYHHHTAVNTWMGTNLLARTKELLGLRTWEIAVNAEYFAEIQDNIARLAYPATITPNQIILNDCVGAELHITIQ